MNDLEHQLDYPLGDQLPAPGGSIEVAPGVRWVRMDLPFVLNHINLWLLRDEIDGRAGWTLVDCCIDRPESRAQWEQVIATQLDGLPLLRVIVTHMHPDHIGLAHWLCARFDAMLWISAADFNGARIGARGASAFGGDNAALFFAANGMRDPGSLDLIRARGSYYPGLVPDVPQRYQRLLDGMHVTIGGEDWQCIVGYGHAPEHMALVNARQGLLLSGDMVLPRISTNVSVYEVEPLGNPLELFLSSLERYRPLRPDTLVLPSHGKPFRGLHTRLDQLHDHHRERLDEVLQACREKPCSGMDIIPVMFRRPLDLHQTTFAMGEAIAHLHALWRRGVLRRAVDAEGVIRFAPA